MAIGRISGPLLKANLVRDGVDLAFETDLLYLDVTNSRIGINTPTPSADLDVNGRIKTTNITIDDTLIVGDITFSGNSISSSSTLNFLSAAGQAAVYHAKLKVDDLQLDDNRISTTISNADIELVPNGTGIVDIQSNSTVNGDLDVTGNISATGNVTIGGNIILGNEVTDTITVNARISGDLIPDATATYDIGTPTARWRNGYFNNFSVSSSLTLGSFTFSGNTIISSDSSIIFSTPNGNSVIIDSILDINDIRIIDNVISTTVSNSSIDIRPNGSGTIELEGNTNVTGNTTVSGNTTIDGELRANGNVFLGNNSSDTVTFNGEINTGLIPNTDNSYDLGSSSLKWNTAYVNSFISSTALTVGSLSFSNNNITTTSDTINFQTALGSSVNFDSKLSVGDYEIDNNTISTTVSNSSIDIRPNGTGTVELQANTNIAGNLIVSGNIVSVGNITVSGNSILGDTDSDTVTFNSEINSNLIPNASGSFDIGSSSQKWNNGYFNNIISDNSLTVGTFEFSNGTITSTTGSITLSTPPDSSVLFDSKLRVGDIEIDNNTISTVVSNASIDIRPNGAGTIELEATTNVTGNLNVSGNITAQGNITIGGNVIIGDSIADTVTFNASINSDLIPQANNVYDLGSSSFQWKSVYTTTLYTESLNIPTLVLGNLTFTDTTISTSTGTDLILDGNGSGGVQLSNFLFSGNTITNVVADSVSVIAQTGTGYFKIDTNNGFVIPVGTTAQRPTSYAVIGMTRYNTDLGAIEIWDGFSWASPAGEGGAITEASANDIALALALALG